MALTAPILVESNLKIRRSRTSASWAALSRRSTARRDQFANQRGIDNRPSSDDAFERLDEVVDISNGPLKQTGRPFDVAITGPGYFELTTPDGVAYTSRHDPSELCWALFGVGSPAVEEIERETALDVNWFWELAETYHLGRPPT